MSRAVLALSTLFAVACQGGAAPEGDSRATAPAAAPEAPAPAAPAAAEQEPTSQPTSQPASPQAAADGYEASDAEAQEDGSMLYGQALDPSAKEVPLKDLLADPKAYAGTTVRTSGKVSRVCKNMGCWMELSEESGAGEVRAPLAGHSYFLPQSAIGKRASVQGEVDVRPLSEAQRAHLEAEGAKATRDNVSIVATGVALK